MPRKANEAVSEGNGPVDQEEEFGSGQPAPVDVFQRIDEIWDRGLVCMCVCVVITYSRVWINRVRLPILLVVS